MLELIDGSFRHSVLVFHHLCRSIEYSLESKSRCFYFYMHTVGAACTEPYVLSCEKWGKLKNTGVKLYCCIQRTVQYLKKIYGCLCKVFFLLITSLLAHLLCNYSLLLLLIYIIKAEKN